MVWLIYKDFDSSIRAVTPVGFQVRLSKISGIFQTCNVHILQSVYWVSKEPERHEEFEFGSLLR